MISYAELTQSVERPAPPPSSRSLDLLISPGTLFAHCRSQLVPNMSTEGIRLAYPSETSRKPGTENKSDLTQKSVPAGKYENL